MVQDKPTPTGRLVLSKAEDIANLTTTLKDAITKDHKTVHVHWWTE